MGDAVVALQNNVTQITHTHDGTGLNGDPIDQANSHENADTDHAANSLHHTIGTGATQAAAGNHNHDTKYVDFATNQTINGIKTLNAPIISTLVNAQHHHTNAANGGMTASGQMSSLGSEALHPTTLGTSTTTDFYLTGTFTLPANMGLTGSCVMNYIAHNLSGAAKQHDTYMYITYNVGPAAPTFNNSYNIVSGLSDHMRKIIYTVNGTDTYEQLVVPVQLPATSAPRTMRLAARVVNNSLPIIACNFVFQSTFTTYLF